MDSPPVPWRPFPRRVGPKLVAPAARIAPVGGSVPNRQWAGKCAQHRVSPRPVIRACNVQVARQHGFARRALSVEEIKLENGDISLREFIRQVAAQGLPWGVIGPGLYITKPLEVIHRPESWGGPPRAFGINSISTPLPAKGFYRRQSNAISQARK